MVIYSTILTLAPAVRLHSWQVDYKWQHWLGFIVWVAGFSLLHRQTCIRLPDRDPYILPVVAFLSGLGILTIWRLDIELGARQTIWLAISLMVVWWGLRITHLLEILRRYKYFWLFIGLFLTGLTFFFGIYPGGEGSRLWLGTFSLQNR
jgi:cell division protein FtsW (lipid II flippase)